jgi:IS5 family transposase
LKHAFNVSDEELVERWSENVVWQYFSGQEYYTPKLPCDATQIGRFRTAIGEAGVEELLKASIDAAVGMKAIQPSECERVIVDTTVQEKAIAHPVDSRLLEVARGKAIEVSRAADHCLEAELCQGGKRFALAGRQLCPRQTIQAAEAGGQAATDDPGHCAARNQTQAGAGETKEFAHA